MASNNNMLPFYSGDYFRHNLRRGTVVNRGGTRFCMMPSELLLALRLVLEEETGEAWTQVLGRVGRIWGKRVAKRFNSELSSYYGRPLHEMPVREFTRILEGYFDYHGWGTMTIDMSVAETGFILAKLQHSAFVEVTGTSKVPVDAIVEGLLAEFFCQVSERGDIDCVETQCAATGAPDCRFIIGLTSRLETTRNLLAAGRSHGDIVAALTGQEVDGFNQDTVDVASATSGKFF
jgi:hypothetical protein